MHLAFDVFVRARERGVAAVEEAVEEHRPGPSQATAREAGAAVSSSRTCDAGTGLPIR
jgi:hypothetical protein